MCKGLHFLPDLRKANILQELESYNNTFLIKSVSPKCLKGTISDMAGGGSSNEGKPSFPGLFPLLTTSLSSGSLGS